MFNKNKFRASVIKEDRSMEWVALQLGISITTLYRKMNGASDFTRTEIQAVKDMLNLSIEEAEQIFFA